MSNKEEFILYITYTDMKNDSSGSGVRPIQIYKAFFSEDYNVKLLSGSILKEFKKERIKNIKEINNWLKYNTPKFCYIESPGDPIIFKEDRNLIKKIHKMNVKIGYFYRDAYYKLGKERLFHGKKITFKQYIRYLYYKLLHLRDEFVLKKYVDIVYFPSITMANYFDFKDKRTLPPAGNIVNYNRKNAKSVIYVGGISKEYGTNFMLEAMDLVNKNKFIELILVCREEEVKDIEKKYLDRNWLKIYNVSGEKNLKTLYEKARFALYPLEKSIYNDFAISVKIFEYMSYGLPILSTNLIETSKIINKYNIGIITNQDLVEYSNAILELYNDSALLQELSNNVKKSIKNNLWTTRIQQIVTDLSEV